MATQPALRSCLRAGLAAWAVAIALWTWALALVVTTVR